jgi:Flp pilus assembly protein TadD
MASMDYEQFSDVVATYGGHVGWDVATGTSLVVIGQKSFALTKDGGLPNKLRLARVRLQAGLSRARVLTEDEFLTGLGLTSHRELVRRTYSETMLAEVLNIPRMRLVAWVRAGLVEPIETRSGVMHFDFQQAAAAKQVHELAAAGVSLGRLRRSLEKLRRWVPEAARPLERLALFQDGGRVLVRLEEGALAEPDGQIQFEFTEEPPMPPMRLVPGPRTPADWFEQGMQQEAEGLYVEAVESYRDALLLGGSDAEVVFGLANALRASGRLAEASERFRQAVEIDPHWADAWNNLGAVLLDLGHIDEAIEVLKSAVSEDPSDSRAHYNLADALDEAGRSSEALPHWREFLRWQPHGEHADYARQRFAARSA